MQYTQNYSTTHGYGNTTCFLFIKRKIAKWNLYSIHANECYVPVGLQYPQHLFMVGIEENVPHQTTWSNIYNTIYMT